MAVICPNTNHPDWKKLVNALGENGAYKVFIANNEEIPSSDKVDEIIDYNRNQPKEDFQRVINKYGTEENKDYSESMSNIVNFIENNNLDLDIQYDFQEISSLLKPFKSSDKVLKALERIVSPMLSKVKAKVEFKYFENRQATAFYSLDSNVIVIPIKNLSMGYASHKDKKHRIKRDINSEQFLKETFIHEAVHALTSIKLSAIDGSFGINIPPNILEELLGLTERDFEIHKKLNNILNLLRDKAVTTPYYGLTNIKEMLSEALSNQEFISFMASVQLPEDMIEEKADNAFVAFIRYIMQLLGLDKINNSAYEEVVNLSKELADNYNSENISNFLNILEQLYGFNGISISDEVSISTNKYNERLQSYIKDNINKKDIPKGKKNEIGSREKASPERERNNTTWNEYVWAVENSFSTIAWDTQDDTKWKYHKVYNIKQVAKLNKILKDLNLDKYFKLQWNKQSNILRVETISDNILELSTKFPSNYAPTQGVLFRERRTLKERIQDSENKEDAFHEFTKNFKYKPPSEAQRVFDDIFNALKRRRKIIERSGKVLSLELSDKFMQELLNEEDYVKRIVMIVKNAHQEITDIKKEYDSIMENPKHKLDPTTLLRWKDFLSAYDSLDEYEPYISFRKQDFIDEKTKKDIKDLLSDVIRNKNAIKQLYRTEGIHMMVDFLSPHYNLFYAKNRIYAQREYDKKIRKYKKDNNIKSTKEAIEKFGVSREEYVNQYVESRKEDIDEETKSFIHEQLLEASRDVNTLYRWVDNVLDTKDPVVAALTSKFEEVHHRSRLDAMEKRNELLEIIQELEEFHKNKNWDTRKIYDFMLEKNDKGEYTGHYITNFKSQMLEDYYDFLDFWRKLELNVDQMFIMKKVWKDGVSRLTDYEVKIFEDIIKKHQKILKENKRFDDMMGTLGNMPLQRTKFYNGLDSYLATLESSGKITRKEYVAIKQNSKKQPGSRRTTAEMVKDGLILYETGELITQWIMSNSWDYRIPKEEYINPQYINLSKITENPNDPRTKLYKYIVEMNKDANRKLPFRYRIGTRLPGVVKTVGERIIERQSPSTIFMSSFSFGVQERKEDIDLGTQDEGRSEIDTSKKLIDTSRSDQEKHMKYFLPIYYTAKPPIKDQSFDVPTVYLKFWEMANDFSLKSEILPELEMAKSFVEERDVLLNRKEVDEKGAVKRYKSKNNTAEQLHDWFLAVVYGRKRAEGKHFKIAGKEFSVEKILDLINKYTSLNLLGFNFVQGTANVILGKSLQILESVAGEHINMNSYWKGNLYYEKNLHKILGEIGDRRPTSTIGMLIEYFDILDDYYSPEFRKNNKFRQLMNTNTLFFTSHAGEHFMQGTMMAAFLEDKKAYDKDGNLLGSMLEMYEQGEQDYKENLKKKYKDKWKEHYKAELRLPDKVDLKNSKWEDTNKEQFRRKLKAVLSRLHGEYSSNGRVAIQRYALGRMTYMFRKFIIPGFKRRWDGNLSNDFDENNYIERLTDFQEGNYITFLKFMKNMFKDANLFKLSMWTENWQDMTDHQRSNVIRTLGEFIFFINSLLLGSLFLKLEGEEDDENKEKLLAFFAYQMYRFKAELLFFTNPNDALAILRSPMASMSVFENAIQLFDQMFNPLEMYEKGPWKGQPKIWKEFNDMIPVRRQFYRVSTLGNTINWFR